VGRTSIEWTELSWPVVNGCRRKSAGCERCYAEQLASTRLRHQPKYKGLAVYGKNGPRWTGETRLWRPDLSMPLRKRGAYKIFVADMGDLFYEGVPDEVIDQVFGVMWACLYDRHEVPWHTFQVLTKRAERMLRYLSAGDLPERWARAAVNLGGGRDPDGIYDQTLTMARKGPHPRIWLGISAENQQTLDERYPYLAQCPAAVRWISYEPALEEVDFGLQSATCGCCHRWPSRWVRLRQRVWGDWPRAGLLAEPGIYRASSNRHGALSVLVDGTRVRRPVAELGIKPDEFECLPAPDWIVIGGESGRRARPFNVAWAESALDQAEVGGVAVFLKQFGSNTRIGPEARPEGWPVGSLCALEGGYRVKLDAAKGGDMHEWPERFRVRQFPLEEALHAA